MTWLPGSWHLQAFLFQRNHKVLAVQTKVARQSFSHARADNVATHMGRHHCVPVDDSYVATAAREAGSVAELAAAWKSAKYTKLDSGYSFQRTAMETLGPINNSARNFLSNLGCKISLQSGNDGEFQ